MAGDDVVTRDEMDRELVRVRDDAKVLEQRIAVAEQGRWAEHGRQHLDERAVLSELRSDFKAAVAGFERVLSEIGTWRGEIKGQLTVLKYLLSVAIAVLVPLIVMAAVLAARSVF